MLSDTFHDWGVGADDPDLSVALTRSMATLSSSDLLYIIRLNVYFSQAVGDTSFPLWIYVELTIVERQQKIVIHYT